MKTITVPDDVAAKVEPIVAGMTNDYQVAEGTDLEYLNMVMDMFLSTVGPDDMISYFRDMWDLGSEGWSDIQRSALVDLFNDMVKYAEARK